MAWEQEKKEKYTIFKPIVTNAQNFEKDILSLNTAENKIIDTRSVSLSENAIAHFAKLFNQHANDHLSFITVVPSLDEMSRLEDYFVAVPTISEAIDYIYMEELERNL